MRSECLLLEPIDYIKNNSGKIKFWSGNISMGTLIVLRVTFTSIDRRTNGWTPMNIIANDIVQNQVIILIQMYANCVQYRRRFIREFLLLQNCDSHRNLWIELMFRFVSVLHFHFIKNVSVSQHAWIVFKLTVLWSNSLL